MATEGLYQQMVDQRQSKVRVLMQWLNKDVTVEGTMAAARHGQGSSKHTLPFLIVRSNMLRLNGLLGLGSLSTSDASSSQTDQSLLSLTDQAVARCCPRTYGWTHPLLE